ncbi:MAG: birA, partial [Firmicutes bacterium]|nr:birA [Bacillota bacterium]
MKNEIIQALLDTLYISTEYVSGELLSRRFGVSRAAVSKAIQSLTAAGWPIESVKHHGYRLSHLPDLLVEPILSDTLHRQGVRHFASSVQAWPSLDSTNLAARRGVEAGDPDGSLYVADEQTAGRGRRGKTWRSASGEGLWFSLLLIPDFAPELMARITLFAGLCAATALRELTSLDIRLKWPNDLVVLPEGRKLGGILTEMMVEENHIAGVIVGIGINVSTPEFPPELSAIATSLELAIRSANPGKPGHSSDNPAPADPAKTRPTRIELLAAILKQFENRWPDYNRMIKSNRT